MNVIDRFLNSITMYRLVLYSLIALLLIAVLLSFAGRLPYDPLSIVFTSVILVAACWLTDTIFAKLRKVPRNQESFFITALILSLLLAPATSLEELPILFGIALLAMGSKYLLVIKKKHLFNPAAVAVAISAVVFGTDAIWWAGSSALAPFVLIAGVLITRKIKRWSLVLSFLAVATLIQIAQGNFQVSYLYNSPLLFLAFIMLTEPQTTPPTRKQQVLYGSLVGLLYSSSLHFGALYTTPEISLLIGNLFTYLVSPKCKEILTLTKKIELAPDTYEFAFTPNISFHAGQYMEWTLPHARIDTRGNRRYFTIASSPTEKELKIGVRIGQHASTFKTELKNLQVGGTVLASGLSGEFVLPAAPGQKLVFIAGGIGITPFRSMIQYLVDTNQKRDVVLLYSAKKDEFVYKDVFEKAVKIGVQTNYLQSRLTSETLKKAVPDCKERTFYLSGPRSMVVSFEKILQGLGVSRSNIKVDYFPGYA